MDIRNPAKNSLGTIDAEILHPKFGWIPATLDPNDPETAELYSRALAGDVAAYVAPPEPTLQDQRADMVASPAQMRLALLAAGRLDAVEAIVAADPRASIVWEYSTAYRRSSPLIDALGGPGGFTPEEIDALFIAAAQIDTGAAQ